MRSSADHRARRSRFADIDPGTARVHDTPKGPAGGQRVRAGGAPGPAWGPTSTGGARRRVARAGVGGPLGAGRPLGLGRRGPVGQRGSGHPHLGSGGRGHPAGRRCRGHPLPVRRQGLHRAARPGADPGRVDGGGGLLPYRRVLAVVAAPLRRRPAGLARVPPRLPAHAGGGRCGRHRPHPLPVRPQPRAGPHRVCGQPRRHRLGPVQPDPGGQPPLRHLGVRPVDRPGHL